MDGKRTETDAGTRTEIRNEKDARRQLAALREIGNQLQIKAERMRLLARAEEGLDDGEMNPYTTVTLHEAGGDTIVREDGEAKLHEVQSKIPVSHARQRHRDKKIKTAGAQSKIDIRKYRPNYTWNRGGRMKELRIRCIARKFLHIWMKNTYGRVLPSVASAHYNRKLKKEIFSEWYDMWWEARREWRLMVRAECHHRYVLWLKSFSAWREFIAFRRVENNKVIKAEQHGAHKVLRKCLDAWLVYVECRRHKKEKSKRAIQHYKQTQTRHTWEVWCGRFTLVQERKQMEVVALQFWAYRIQAQHWLMWCERLQQTKNSIRYHLLAIRHNNTVLVKKCLHSWIMYWARRRQKLREKAYGEFLYHKKLLRKAYLHWYDQYKSSRAVADHQEKMDNLARTFQLRRMFTNWRHYIDLQHDSRNKEQQADLHYLRHLLVVGLSGFRLHVVQQRIKAMRHVIADELRQKQLMRWAWNHWLTCCENNEELRMFSLTRKARLHYHVVLMKKVMEKLQEYCEWRKHRKVQYARADAYYYVRMMPQYMFRMKVFVQLMRNKRENVEKQQGFRRENVQARFFYQWYNAFEFSKEYRMNERMAILHYDDSVVKRFFHQWSNKTHLSLEEAENMEVANEHYCVSLCRRHIRTWKQHVEDIKTGQRHEVMACGHYCQHAVTRCFSAWKLYTQHRHERRMKKCRADRYFQKVLCRKVMSAWMSYTLRYREIKERAEVKFKVKCMQTLGQALLTWRGNVTLQIQEREAEDQATQHCNRQLLMKVMKTWHRYAAIHAYKKSETQQWVNSAKEELRKKKLCAYFWRWREAQSEAVSDHIKSHTATEHHNICSLQKVMTTWKQFTQVSIKKSLLVKQSEWFHRVSLLARYFVQWKHAHAEALEHNEKVNLALWHWCLNLQRKVLVVWYAYTQERKRKKERISAALERRRLRLLRDGVTQWLLVANDLSAMRAKFAAQQQATSAYETYQLVQRCALHWRHWAARQKHRRGGVPLPKRQPLPQNRSTPREVHLSHVQPGRETNLTLSKDTGSTSDTYFEDSGPLRNLGLDVMALKPLLQGHSVVGAEQKVPFPVPTRSPMKKGMDVPPLGAAGQGVRLQSRAKPRRPAFLVESLKRAGLYSASMEDFGTSTGLTQESTQEDGNVAESGGSRDVRFAPVEIEKLNLSNLSAKTTSERSADQSEPTHVVPTELPNVETNLISDWTKQLPGLSARSEDEHFPSKGLPFLTDFEKNSQKFPNVPKEVKLLTPADFMLKGDSKSASSETYSAGQRIMGIYQSVQSSNGYPMSQKSSNEFPLSQETTPRTQDGTAGQQAQGTYTISEVLSREVTPRDYLSSGRTPRESLSRDITPRDQDLKDLSQDRNALLSNSRKEIQKEVIQIRNQLKTFDEKKKRLRTMQKQLQHLTDWLKEQEVRGQTHEDQDITSVQQEITELSQDVSELKSQVEQERPSCTRLVQRVQELRTQLSTL